MIGLIALRPLRAGRRGLVSRKSRTYCFFACFACNALVSYASLANAGAAEAAVCPAASSTTGVFTAGKIYQDSVISIEKSDADQTISLSIYRSNSSGCEKSTFAKYSIEGGAPSVDSLFFMSIKGKVNIVTIVHWDVSSRGIGTFGRYYQIYAYAKDENGRLIENKSIADNSTMRGMDGYQEGEESTFSYKTAGAVKSFFKCGRAKCK